MGARPFTDTLRAIRFGELQEELTEQMNALTKACTESGRAGELVLKIKLKPGKGGQVELLDDLSTKLPKQERGTSIFFATPEGNLQREDPRQMDIAELRQVKSDTTEPLRNVSNA